MFASMHHCVHPPPQGTNSVSEFFETEIKISASTPQGTISLLEFYRFEIKIPENSSLFGFQNPTRKISKFFLLEKGERAMADQYRLIHDNRVHGHIADHNKKRNYVTGIHNFKLNDEFRQNVETEWLEKQTPRKDTFADQLEFPPVRFPQKGAPLRVPKTVIVSFHPFWVTATAQSYQWRYPHGVVFMDLATGIMNNYVYVEQWDETGPQPEGEAMYSPLATSQFYGYTNELIGTTHNPIYDMFDQLKQAVKEVGEWLHSLKPKGEYNIIAPQWVPNPFPQMNNDYLKLSDIKHDGGSYVHPMHQCLSWPTMDWNPSFVSPYTPDYGFNGPTCSWLLGEIDPGFGVDILHIFIGHPVLSYGQATSYDQYIAWPMSPEAGYIGPVPALWDYRPTQALVESGKYQWYWGRRPAWASMGYAYGYPGAGFQGLYAAAAESHKANWYKYRNIRTMIYVPDVQWIHSWQIMNLYKDNFPGCIGPFFWFGYDTFGEFLAMAVEHTWCPQDYTWQDTTSGPVYLKMGSVQGKTIYTCTIDPAVKTIWPGIQRRIEDYYNNIAPNSSAAFSEAVESNELEKFGVTFEGGVHEITAGMIKSAITDYWPHLAKK